MGGRGGLLRGFTLPRGSKYPITRYFGFRVIVIIVQVLGKYMIIRYLDPEGSDSPWACK